MARRFAPAALTILGLLPFGASAVDSFTVYTDTFELREGEVHNKPRKPRPLPSDIVKSFANRSMAIVGYDFDIVQIRDGQEVPLPLSSIYNHHYLMAFGTEKEVEGWYNVTNTHDPLNPNPAKACFAHAEHMHDLGGQLPARNRSHGAATFGGGSGAEYRHTSYDLPFPARHILESPEYFSVLLHFINTRGEIGLLECPCTSARKINVTNGTIDGYKPLPFNCNTELLAQGNPSCSLETYVGGYRCCEDGNFVIEDPDMQGPTVQVAAKITVRFEEVAPETKKASSTSCCDATGDTEHFGNIEYDIPKCQGGGDCVHMVESIQTIDAFRYHAQPDELIDLIWAYGHQHVGGMGMELYHLRTGQRLCESVPIYGKGDAAGDEDGYVVGISTCKWGPPPLLPPPRLRRGDLMRTVARYNSTKEHRGVMSLWLISKVLVPNSTSSNFDAEGPLFV